MYSWKHQSFQSNLEYPVKNRTASAHRASISSGVSWKDKKKHINRKKVAVERTSSTELLLNRTMNRKYQKYERRKIKSSNTRPPTDWLPEGSGGGQEGGAMWGETQRGTHKKEALLLASSAGNRNRGRTWRELGIFEEIFKIKIFKIVSENFMFQDLVKFKKRFWMIFLSSYLSVWPTHSQRGNQPTNHQTKIPDAAREPPVNIFPFWEFPYRNTICKLAEWIAAAAAAPRRRRSFPSCFLLDDAQRVLEPHHVSLVLGVFATSSEVSGCVATISLGPFLDCQKSNYRKKRSQFEQGGKMYKHENFNQSKVFCRFLLVFVSSTL